jgi:hypothetical protein
MHKNIYFVRSMFEINIYSAPITSEVLGSIPDSRFLMW